MKSLVTQIYIYRSTTIEMKILFFHAILKMSLLYIFQGLHCMGRKHCGRLSGRATANAASCRIQSQSEHRQGNN